MATNLNINCQYSTRYCWEADKVKSLIRLRAELSPLFTGKRNASKYAWAVVERELNVPLPLSKIIKKWNNLLQEYKAIKISEEPKRREWPFFTLMDVYFSDQVNDPSLRLFSSTKTLTESIDDSVFEDDPIISSAIAAATSGAYMDIDELVRRQKEQKYQIDRKPIFEVAADELTHGNNCNDTSDINSSLSERANMQQHDVIRSKQCVDEIPSPITHNKIPSYDLNNNPKLQCHKDSFSEQNTIDQYLLSWNNFHGNMCRGFHSLQKDEKMVDVTIAAGGKIFKAHKLVLSVCSSYFQQIFLENPSSHPILLMADVESSHMAGLLDFMYSGQVNVKYDDLPVFLKVAEAMKIKGLHTEKQNETDGDGRDSIVGREVQEMDFQKYSNTHASSLNAIKISERQSPNSHFSPNYQLPSISQPISFREHIRTKKDYNEAMSNSMANNNNNNIKIEDTALIPQINNSNKILDGRKHSKYFSKRKMLMQYNEHVLMKEKKSKPVNCPPFGGINVNSATQNQLTTNNPPPSQDNNIMAAAPHDGCLEALNLVQCPDMTNDELNKKSAFLAKGAVKRIMMESLQSQQAKDNSLTESQFDKRHIFQNLEMYKQDSDLLNPTSLVGTVKDDNNNCKQNINQNVNPGVNGTNTSNLIKNPPNEDANNQSKLYKSRNIDIIRSHITSEKVSEVCDNNNNNYASAADHVNGNQPHTIKCSDAQ